MLLARASTSLLPSAQALLRAQNSGYYPSLHGVCTAEEVAKLPEVASIPLKAPVGPPVDPPVPQAPEYEGESDSLREFRLHNSSIWGLKGQVISGKVIVVGKDYVVVDLGFKAYSRFFKKELSTSQIYEVAEGHKVKRREGVFFLGDHLRFRVEDVESPYGDMHLTASKLETSIRQELVWKELKEAYMGKIPVQGRVLNPTDRGYAVGIGGFVAFCPLVNLSPDLGNKIGILQPFKIIRLVEKEGTTAGRSITLESLSGVGSLRSKRTWGAFPW